MDDATDWGNVMVALQEAQEGSRRLDALIAYHSGAADRDVQQMIRLLIDEGSAWDLIFELMEGDVPAYTTSLDARVPGENIVCALFSTKYGRWAAVHRGTDETEVLAWAGTEILARRVAGLRAIRGQTVSPREPQPEILAPEKLSASLPEPVGALAERPELVAAEDDWKVLF